MCPSPVSDSSQRGYVIPMGGALNKRRHPTVLQRFHQLAGGDDSRILVIPTASELEETGPEYAAFFEDMGGRAISIPVEQREDCLKQDILEKLASATAVFITGGNQLRLSTILGGTPVAKMIRQLNAEGIHIGGTSAGAAIMSEHMIAGGRSGPTPKEDGATMAPGLGLTNKVIIDQHFRQRNRLGRLMSALSYNPFVCGLGIDEDTAAFIGPDGTLEVVGSGGITVVDPSNLVHSSMHDARHQDVITLIGLGIHILGPGARFNIDTREVFPPGD